MFLSQPLIDLKRPVWAQCPSVQSCVNAPNGRRGRVQCWVLQGARTSEALTGPWNTARRGSGGALPPNGVSSSLLPHRAAFITALGVGFEGFLWSLWVRLCHHSSLPELQSVLPLRLLPALSITLAFVCATCYNFFFFLLCVIWPCFLLLLVHTVKYSFCFQLQLCNQCEIIFFKQLVRISFSPFK